MQEHHSVKFPTIKGVKIHIEIDPTVVPIALRVRPVPMKLKTTVEEELNKMLQAGIIEPVPKPSAMGVATECSSQRLKWCCKDL